MTEEELRKLELDVLGETLPDIDIEKEWLHKQLDGDLNNPDMVGLYKQEQQLIAAFKFQKAMRKDNEMQNLYKSLCEVRNGIKYLQQRLIDLG